MVKTATGVDLSTLSTVTEFTNACTGLGGAYKAADTPSAIANALVAAAVLPLNTQISGLQAQGTPRWPPGRQRTRRPMTPPRPSTPQTPR